MVIWIVTLMMMSQYLLLKFDHLGPLILHRRRGLIPEIPHLV
jgi:hypothetical protein